MVLKKMNKKGIFFTIVSILAVTILFVAFTSKEYVTGIDRTPVMKDRIMKSDNFVRNLEDSYLERVLRFSSYMALRALSLYIENQSKFFNTTNFDCAFETVVITGALSNSTWTELPTDTYFDTTPQLADNTGDFLGNRFELFGANHVLAQMFIPHTSGNLQSAEFYLDWQYPPPGNFKNIIVELRTDICNMPSNDVLDIATVNPPGSAGWIYMTATFSKQPYIYAGQKYYFVFKSVDAPLDQTRVRTTDDDYTNGTMYSSDSPSIMVNIDDVIGQPIMQGNTLLERLESIENASRRILFIETDFDLGNVTIYQNNDTAHWYVRVDMNISYNVNSSIAFWKNSISVSSFLSILGLEDPYYYVMSGGIPNIIENELESITTEYLTKNFLWNLTYLKQHINYMTYKPEEQAPSFLMRFINNTGASLCCGIESIIYHSVDKNMTYIDYCFWNETCPGSDPDGNYSLYNITGITTPSYSFKLEPYHWRQYNVSEYAVWTNVTP